MLPSRGGGIEGPRGLFIGTTSQLGTLPSPLDMKSQLNGNFSVGTDPCVRPLCRAHKQVRPNKTVFYAFDPAGELGGGGRKNLQPLVRKSWD